MKTNNNWPVCVALFFFLIVLVSTDLQAQNDEIGEFTSTYALKNVTVHTQPGQIQEGVTVVISEGKIIAVGKSVTIPPDAEVLEVDSMHVYAGFVAGISHAGVPKPEAKENNNARVKDPGNPPNELAGITPYMTVREVMKSSDKSIEDMRKLGFAVAHAVPRGRMLPGQGSLLLLHGGTADDVLMQENMSMFSQIVTARRMYPGTVMGVMAKWRDLYRSAKMMDKHETLFKNNSATIKRPSTDNATKAMVSVYNKKLPVFFKTDKTLTYSRASALQKELGFDMVPVELKQGYMNIKKLKANNKPVLISLALPKEIKEEKKKKEKSADDKKEKPDPEVTAMKERQKKSYMDYVSQAAKLRENNVQIGFSYLDVKTKDIRPNILKLVKNGLSEDDALAALTTIPSQMLGISNLTGTVTKGKMANLVVTDSSYFNKEAQIRYMFIDGKKFEYDAKKKTAKKEGATADVDIVGTWDYAIEIPGVEPSGKLTITKLGDNEFNIEMTNDDDASDIDTIESVTLDGNKMNFDFQADNGGFSMDVNVALEFDGESFEGNVTAGQFGTFPISGDKLSTPK